MSKKRTVNRAREPSEKRSLVWLTDSEGFKSLECKGYTSLSHNPEIMTAVDTLARLMGAMTIHLMHNTDLGDERIKNGLSEVIDIRPNRYMTRSNFIHWIIRTLYLEGNGNSVVYPLTENGYLRELIPIPAALTAFFPSGEWGYKVVINGIEYNPDDVLHFVINPSDYFPWHGQGYKISLADVANNLKQAAATEKGFMASKWKPSLIVKVDSLTDEFSTKAGRKKLLEDYVESGEAGEPWLIPAEQFSVEQVKPLTLSDLALADFVTLDKQTVASILGIPPFVLGVGEFKRDAWNSFIASSLMPLAQNIQQEFTRKLLYGPEYYFRFNPRSLYNYDLRELAAVADDQYVRGIMTGNEVRDWIGLSPKARLDKLVILENYIPLGMIGDQKKLNGGGESNEQTGGIG